MAVMGQPPKKRTTSRKRGMRRSHEFLKLARRVNAASPVKVYEKRRQAKVAKPAAKKA